MALPSLVFAKHDLDPTAARRAAYRNDSMEGKEVSLYASIVRTVSRIEERRDCAASSSDAAAHACKYRMSRRCCSRSS